MSDDLIKQIDSAIEKTSTDIAEASVDYFRIETEVAVLLQKRLQMDSATALLKARGLCAEVAHDLQQAITDRKGEAVEFPQGIVNDLLKAALPGVLDVTVSKVKEVQAEAAKKWNKPVEPVDPRLVP